MFLAGAKEGTIRTRSRQAYKPATLARYRRALDQQLLPELGSLKLNEILGSRITRVVGKLQARGLSANSIRNSIMPLQAIYRWAIRMEYARVDPTRHLELPLDRGRRDRFATPQEVSLLLAALDGRDRPLWATALYAGLRRGELMALRWSDIDLATGVISVERSHDPEAGTTGETKSAAGHRRVPIAPVLRDLLLEHRLRHHADNDHRGSDPLVFSRRSLAGRFRSQDGPFTSAVGQRARRRWEAQGLDPISLHEARHTYASLMIAAGESAKALQTCMGHSSIATTYDRYGHLMPDAESESAARLQNYLDSGHKIDSIVNGVPSATKTATEGT